MENKHFVSLCPFVSRFPFEVHIIPKEHHSHFCQMQEVEKINLSEILKETLKRLKDVLSDPPYNFIIHTAPYDKGDHEYYHWHIEIIPRLTRVAGLEWGTGFYVVPTPPEVAIKYLKGN